MRGKPYIREKQIKGIEPPRVAEVNAALGAPHPARERGVGAPYRGDPDEERKDEDDERAA